MTLKALAYHLRLVVLALCEGSAAAVACARLLGRAMLLVVDLTTAAAQPSAAQAPHDLVVRRCDVECGIGLFTLGGQRLVERFRLLERARKAIKDGAALRVRLVNAFQ